MLSPSIKAVIFDLDDTLYAEVEYFVDVFQSNKLTSSYSNEIRCLFDAGIRKRSYDVFKDVLKHLNCYTPEAQNNLYQLYRRCKSKISLDQDTQDALSILLLHKVHIGILTNGVVDAQKNKIRCLGLDQYPVVYARESGNEKPHLHAFQLICKKLDVHVSECILIGDHVVNDIKGAIDAGIRPIQLVKFNTDSDCYPGVTCVNSLTEAVNGIFT